VSEDFEERWDRGGRTFYIAEIVRQETYALTALDQAIKAANDSRNTDTWPAIQAFLSATANVSKLLWSVRSDKSCAKAHWKRFRGERLRTELDVSDSSPLKSRRVRDSADHFDERIDDLVRNQEIPRFLECGPL
jgi:hypothetical protein